MAPVVPTTVPIDIETGSTVQFTQQPADFPTSEGWIVKWVVAGASQKSITASVSGQAYLLSLASTDNALAPGTYTWTLYAEKVSPAERYTIATGVITVRPAPQASSAGDMQSQDEQELAVLNAAIKARLTVGGDVQSYTIGDRSLEKIPLMELVQWRNQVRARVIARRRGGPLRAVKTRFPGVSA